MIILPAYRQEKPSHMIWS